MVNGRGTEIAYEARRCPDRLPVSRFGIARRSVFVKPETTLVLTPIAYLALISAIRRYKDRSRLVWPRSGTGWIFTDLCRQLEVWGG